MSRILSWSAGALNTIFIPAFQPSLQWLLLSKSPCLLFQRKSMRLAMVSRLLLKCRFLSVKGGYWELWIGKILRPCPRSSRRNAVHNCRSHLQGKAHQAAQTPLRVCTMTSWYAWQNQDPLCPQTRGHLCAGFQQPWALCLRTLKLSAEKSIWECDPLCEVHWSVISGIQYCSFLCVFLNQGNNQIVSKLQFW